ncbi:helix-turn-helix domain-containing protein [Streptomyces sp. 71268]|uniref:ArsR/SmtB family transcription factor n=1 Tax=Streptomyces sp. 71268 TaxID=3002640 RepID=UPI0023F9AD15|nr:helix-turn-helix domain-containing protein [Streptomyces sp. 71268]WEV29946.1 helix-turn-helix domain-containing protein [Streptomyces sp. 71268]
MADPRALRAYAHPTRMRLVGLLRAQGPCTATRAAGLIGESVASCSYHLRMLAKYGLVEAAGGGWGREKPWRATARFTQWPAYSPEPALADAAEAVELAVVKRYSELLSAAIEARTLPRDWQEAGRISDALLYLTAGELSAVQQQIDALLRPFEARGTRPDSRPPGARLVQVIQAGFALPQVAATGSVSEASRTTDAASTHREAVEATSAAADSDGQRLDNPAGTKPAGAGPATPGEAAVSDIPNPEGT